MMKQYRIGRVQLPWANLDPPIRSPDYYKNLELKKAKAKANGSDRRSKKSIDLGSVGTPTIVVGAGQCIPGLS
jgi:delta8-fatty-acid desaturase